MLVHIVHSFQMCTGISVGQVPKVELWGQRASTFDILLTATVPREKGFSFLFFFLKMEELWAWKNVNEGQVKSRLKSQEKCRTLYSEASGNGNQRMGGAFGLRGWIGWKGAGPQCWHVAGTQHILVGWLHKGMSFDSAMELTDVSIRKHLVSLFLCKIED